MFLWLFMTLSSRALTHDIGKLARNTKTFSFCRKPGRAHFLLCAFPALRISHYFADFSTKLLSPWLAVKRTAITTCRMAIAKRTILCSLLNRHTTRTVNNTTSSRITSSRTTSSKTTRSPTSRMVRDIRSLPPTMVRTSILVPR